ncbi:hypothetical protein sscle_14g097390 [Sclerotinia sclerotiorum 1980 UF-70]|uniref:MalT-like TPR region domain-containing protein n=1 Tax=Sclerotinia sclerotiorum (strain ATCC 18683 / 1980 / Ss-1) TaxID=665079 RepID=A0A1D9QJC0_SCLS1|nr:hypothetical protein sscle_14g097390 [Sclerotinia sclerotiorum 1980 UF-70]
MPKAALQLVNTPGKILLQWSPLFELDIFPTSRNTPSHLMMLPASARSIETWRIELEDWKFKLSKLRKIQSVHNSAIILCIERLIFLHNNLNFDPLELYYQLLDVRLKQVNRNDEKIIATYLDIVEELLEQGKTSEAEHLHRSLHQTIQESGSSVEQSLHIRLSYLEASILWVCGQIQEAENIIRLVIQKALRFLGPSHKITMKAFGLHGLLLGISETESYSGAEKLYRYIIQAGRSGLQNEPWSYFENIRLLIIILKDMKKFEESYTLCTNIMEQLKQTLGECHSCFRQFQCTLSGLLRAWGRLSESIELLHEMITEEDMDRDFLRVDICYELAYALHEDGNYRKAMVWYKRCLLYSTELCGRRSNHMMIMCPSEALGGCYEDLSQFEDALFLYEKLSEKLKIALTDDNPLIKEVERWINWIQYRINESVASIEENEDIIYDMSLDEIFEMEDRELDERIVKTSNQISTIKLV